MSPGSGSMPSARISSADALLGLGEALGRPVLQRLGRALLGDLGHLRGEALGREGRGVGEAAGERDHLRARGDLHQVAHRARAHHAGALGEQRARSARGRRGRVGAAVGPRRRSLGLSSAVSVGSSAIELECGAVGSRKVRGVRRRALAIAMLWRTARRAGAGHRRRAPSTPLVLGPAAAARARRPLRGAEDRAAAAQRRHLGGEADARLGRQRVPQGRVPLPGLPLRRHRRARPAPTPNDPKGERDLRPLGRHLRLPDRRRATSRTSADLVELRVKALDDATAFRLTFNSMTDPKLVGDDDRARRLSPAAGVPARRQRHRPGPVLPHRPRQQGRPARGRRPTHADRTRAEGQGLTSAATRSRSCSRTRPGTRGPRWCGWRPAPGSGTTAAGAYLTPGRRRRRRRPGGAGGLANPPAFFNVAFRFDEPRPARRRHRLGPRRPVVVARPRAGPRARRPATSPQFHANVNFGKLVAGKRDDLTRQARRRARRAARSTASSPATRTSARAPTTRSVLRPRRLLEPAARPAAPVLGLPARRSRSPSAATG